jgi:hypothetical protein
MAETPEQRYERLSRTVRETILRNFPNPERKGCPGDRVVREVAGRRELIEDDAWQHITHCSPCYATFLQFKDEFRSLRRRRGLGIILGAICLIALTTGVVIYEVNHRGEPATIQNEDNYEAARLDLRDRSSQRSATAEPGNTALLALPRKKLNLTILLPFGSEPGKYEVQMRKAGKELVTVGGNADVNQGNTELRIKIDLSKYAAGIYAVAIRQPSSTWVENPVTLR